MLVPLSCLLNSEIEESLDQLQIPCKVVTVVGLAERLEWDLESCSCCIFCGSNVLDAKFYITLTRKGPGGSLHKIGKIRLKLS